MCPSKCRVKRKAKCSGSSKSPNRIVAANPIFPKHITAVSVCDLNSFLENGWGKKAEKSTTKHKSLVASSEVHRV